MKTSSYSRRYSRRSFSWVTFLLRTVIATTFSGIGLAQMWDHFTPERQEDASLAVFDVSQAIEHCTGMDRYRLPETAIVQHAKTDGSVRQMEGENLSSSIEEDLYFRGLQRDKRNEEVALCFLQAYRSVFNLSFPWKELQPIVADPDEEGYTHIRFRQLYSDLPVRGGEVIVHLTPDKKVYRVDGHYYPTPLGLNLQPRISADEATSIAREALGQNLSVQRQYQVIQSVYVDGKSRSHLAYQVTASHKIERGWEIWELWIDATTGNILTKFLSSSS